MAPRLFHIVSADDWSAARRIGVYAPDSLAIEGFVHLSEEHQILRPANLLYRHRTDLWLLVIDQDELGADVVYEPGSHGEDDDFPHLYGPVNLDAVVRTVAFPPGPDGTFALPANLGG